MKIGMLVVAGLVFIPALGLLLLRLWDQGADLGAKQQLLLHQPRTPALYHPQQVAHLAPAVQRYFNYVIAQGTPLWTVVEIEMAGELSLGDATAPNYQPLRAYQLLSGSSGFIWQARLPAVSGSDAGFYNRSWTRFRLLNLIPVARAGGNDDHLRSAFGRFIAEAVFWAPASLLPGPGVIWEQISHHQIRVTVSRGDLSQAVDVYLTASGQPHSVSLLRWSDVNPQHQFQWQPFGGTLSDFRDVQGFRLPFQVTGGHQFGTAAYFPFYKAELLAIRFPGSLSNQ